MKGNENDKVVKNNEKLTTTRRGLLKTAVVGGGVTATAASLPSMWTKPVLNKVLLPAHAQMSVMTGNFATAAPVALDLKRVPSNQGFAEEQFALLNSLIAPAHAGHPGARDFCGAGDDGSYVPGGANIYFRINEDMTVDCAIDGLDGNDSPGEVCGAQTMISDGQIADVDIQISSNNDFFVSLSNIVLAANEITGNYITTTPGGGSGGDTDSGGAIEPVQGSDGEACNGTFTAVLDDGEFPESVICNVTSNE